MKYDELNAINGMFIPERLHMVLNPQNLYESDQISANQKSELVYFHELVHFYQTGMTGYGQSRWNMYRQMTSAIVSDWVAATDKYPEERPMPLAHLGNKSREDLIAAFQMNLQGKDIFVPFALQVFVSDRSRVKADDLGLYHLKGDYYLTPEIKVNGQNYFINGIDILETHAKVLESIYADRLFHIDSKYIMDRTILPKRYYMIWDWFMKMFSEDSILDFLALCDLSLQTSKWNIPQTEFEWQAQHPGWRFFILANALIENKQLMFKSIIDMKSRYEVYADELFDICGFDKFDTIIEDMKSRYEFRCDSCNLLGLEMRMKDVLDYRIKNMWIGAYPILDLEIWSELKAELPPLFLQEDQQLRIVPYDKDEVPEDKTYMSGILGEATLELHLQALANQILGNVSKYLLDIEHIQCGYSYFGFNNSCHYWDSGQCDGSYKPSSGCKVPFYMINDIDIRGCTFDAFLHTTGVGDSKNIELNMHNRKFPTIEELKDMLL